MNNPNVADNLNPVQLRENAQELCSKGGSNSKPFTKMLTKILHSLGIKLKDFEEFKDIKKKEFEDIIKAIFLSNKETLESINTDKAPMIALIIISAIKGAIKRQDYSSVQGILELIFQEPPNLNVYNQNLIKVIMPEAPKEVVSND